MSKKRITLVAAFLMGLSLLVAAGASEAPALAASSPSPTPVACPNAAHIRVAGKCVCRWGTFEVGILNFISRGTDICGFVQSKGVGAPGYVLNGIATILTVLAVIAGVASIMIGGYYYMTAGGSADRVRTAKIWIASALVGITLALLAFTILTLISPAFT